jgi:hypothetical protein
MKPEKLAQYLLLPCGTTLLLLLLVNPPLMPER